jgi:hypothetical protein
MPAEVTSNIYANFGVFGLIVIGFFVMLAWVLRTSSKREDKLYTVITTLSEELPEIRKAIDDINKKMR